MRIVMIGSGYVGLVSGACLADFGHGVTCVDKDAAKIARLKDGEIPIYEPGLDALVARNAEAGRLAFTAEGAEAIAAADVVFIAVGTPSRRGDGYADLSYVRAAARDVARSVTGFTVIVVKSTVPVGTGDEVERVMRDENRGADIAVVSNPEFLREGAAIEDFKRPDRIVVGLEDERAREPMTEVYRPLYLNALPLLFVRRRTSELIKYAGNAFLAMKITFINEMADLCERVDADVQDVARGIGLDGRIGSKFLHAGPGYGGSCFPKDTLALVKTAQDHASPLRLIETTVAVNDQRKRAMARKVADALGGSVRGRKIALLGLTFKPNTDDMRDAPSLAIVQALQDGGASVSAYDPEGMAAAAEMLADVALGASAYEAAEGADALVLVTEWDAFRALDFPRLGEVMRGRTMVDLRNVYKAEDVERHGFVYVGIGRPASLAHSGFREAAE
ncbi:MAG: UDP-glucose/GDP-mannose dehydrogenase family protein [Pseudomonadota bacterium]